MIASYLQVLPLVALLMPPEAQQHEARGVALFDQGRLEDALIEFRAAYAALPAVPRSPKEHAEREMIFGSMHGILWRIHEVDGAPEPLCRIQELLRAHLVELRRIKPDPPELAAHERRLARATQELAGHPTDVCTGAASPGATATAPLPVPPPGPGTALQAPGPDAAPPDPPREPSTPAATPSPDPDPQRRKARGRAIVGAVLLPLGLFAAAGLVATLPNHLANGTAIAGLHRELDSRPCTDADRAELRQYIATAHRQEAALVGLGVTAGALITAGVVLLVRGHRLQNRPLFGLDLRSHSAGLTLSGRF